MGLDEINQMKIALIQQGMKPYKLERLSEDELRTHCNTNLAFALSGEYILDNLDSFHKQLKFNFTYTLPNGQKIKVAKVKTMTLDSGRKVEAFVDMAGGKYFQYRAADNTVLKESYFNKQEKIKADEFFTLSNGDIVKLSTGNCLSNITDSFDKAMEAFQELSSLISSEISQKDKKLADDLYNAFRNPKQNKHRIEQMLGQITNNSKVYMAYSNKYNQDLEDDIASCKYIDDNVKENYFKVLNDYSDKLVIKNSKIKNEFWEGDSFNIKFQGNNVFITNTSNNKKSSINMDKLFENMNIKHKVSMMKYFQTLPGEVLFDISIECKNIDSMAEAKVRKFIDKLLSGIYTKAAAYYHPGRDKITSRNDDTLIHELGHAIDYHYRYKFFNLSEANNNKAFDKAFKLGLARYEKDGYKKDNNIQMFSGKNEYCTTNKVELFAECYDLLMTGDNHSADCILYYFPECLEEAKKILKSTRELPNNKRR